MPRKKFSFAPDAAARRIECEHFELNGGAPRCRALTHPWCLAPGESQLTCRFHASPQQPAPEKPKSRRTEKEETDGT